MDMKVHCPGCRLALRVPTTAAGKQARCPACHHKFTVPEPGALVEETISTWIEEDVDQEVFEHQQQLRESIALQERLKAEAAARELELQKPSTFRIVPPAPPEPRAKPARSTPAQAATGTPSLGLNAPPRAVAHDYPTQLEDAGPRPHLVVHACTQLGVRLAFDSKWLEHEGFRLSMPRRCPFTGQDDPTKLLARPLAFADRSQGFARSPMEIEARYEHHVVRGQTSRELLTLMGVIQHLPKPFNLPMPYYVTAEGSAPSLQCSTHTRDDGGITCEVLIPEGHFALEWLLRVNGACGPEYPLLERDVSLLWSDAWATLPEATRHRIGVWCAFEPGEKFRLYLLDADFKRSDHGLAGVVVTDRRLIFSKFHHRGHAALEEEATLHAALHGEFADLTLDAPNRHTRVARLHKADLPLLEEALRGAPGMKMEVTQS